MMHTHLLFNPGVCLVIKHLLKLTLQYNPTSIFTTTDDVPVGDLVDLANYYRHLFDETNQAVDIDH